MRWFSGPIQDAIATAKHDQKIFLVFVEGKDETSKGMSEKIMEEEISGPIDDNCVSIKLTTDSEPFRQFSQIYPVIVVPSMFFIGSNGIPLEVVAGSENKEDLLPKVQKAIQLHKLKLSESAATTSTAASPAESAPSQQNVPETPAAESPAAESQKSEVQNDTAVDEAPQSETQEVDPETALKQKLERAEQLMTERRRIREKELKEEEKQRELEQRRVGREMQKAREQMKDKEMADWAKQRQREKQEDKAARQRVLAQIAQDKADRAAKQQSPGSSQQPPQADSTTPATAAASSSSSVRQRSPPESASSGQVSRIQFRLPNSVTSNHEFPSGSTLCDVIRHVEQVIKPNLSGFSLATSFPRRHFSRTDFSRTLRDLDLCPSAVLLILPASAANPAQHSSGSGFWAVLWTILSPLTLVWNFVYSFIFGNQRNEALPSTSAPTAAAEDQGPQQPSTEPSRNKAGPSQKPPSASASRYRKDGNVHRLSNESSNDDEDGTWNGNSTQQM